MRRKKIIIGILVLIALSVAIPAGIVALLHSPSAVNTLAAWIQPVTGISMHVDDISLNHHLEATVKGLCIGRLKDGGFDFHLARMDVHAGTAAGFKLVVEKILLSGPKFTFYTKKTKSEIDPFKVLKKLPPVRLLVVQNGEVELKSETSVYSFPGMNIIIRDFEPEGGGKLNGKNRFHIRARGITGSGMLETALDFSRFSPRPSGSGFLRLSLDAGSFGKMKLDAGLFTSQFKLNGNVLSLEGAQVKVKKAFHGEGTGQIQMQDIKAQFSGSYDQKTSGFAVKSFESSGTGFGLLKGMASGTVKPLSWKVSLCASALNLAQISSLANPLLPEDYRNWTFKGKGGLELESEGRYADGSTVWQAAAVVDLGEGGFASADGSKAGERITGRIEIKLGSSRRDRKGSFQMTLQGGDGELLWGRYYQDFRGKRVRILSQGTFSQHPFTLSSSGSVDLFQTGSYTFSADLSQGLTVLFLNGTGVSCPQLFNVLLKNHLDQNYPKFQDLTLAGVLHFKFAASMSPMRKEIEGNLELRGGAAHSPWNELALTGLNLRLPFDLTLAGRPSSLNSSVARQGSLAFEKFEKGSLKIEKMETPVILSGNRLILPNPVAFSLFGGEIQLSGFRAENLLFPEMTAETGLTVKHLKLGEVIGKAFPFPLTGNVEGDLSPIIFQNGKWSAGGVLVARMFGGRIALENLSGGRLFSPSRFFGADASFDDIDLEEITSNIKLGRMTGLIQGSLKNFMMEYGQPSSFDLVITSDRSRKAPQQISVDAIKNLSIISTGSETISDILNSGVNQFFHEYPYSSIGIRCTLADDVFSLRGLIIEGGKEYLIRRAALRGIDIVNQNPDNSIRFKDMSERVGRLFQPRQKSKDMPSG